MKHYEMIPKEVLASAVQNHKAYLSEKPHKRVVCDDTITPFVGAMNALGYKAETQSNGCSILRKCTNDDCQKAYSELYVKDGVKAWGCPHCQRISKS